MYEDPPEDDGNTREPTKEKNTGSGSLDTSSRSVVEWFTNNESRNVENEEDLDEENIAERRPTSVYEEHREYLRSLTSDKGGTNEHLPLFDKKKDENEDDVKIDREGDVHWWDANVVNCSGTLSLTHGETAYRLIGSAGPVCVFLHGLTTFSYIWLGVVTRLLEQMHEDEPIRVLVFDFYGRGSTPWPENQSKCSDELLATQTVEVLVQLQLAEEPVILIGQGIGAAVAALVSAERPKLVSGLMLISPVGLPRPKNDVEKKLDVPLLGDLLFSMEASEYFKAQHQRDFFSRKSGSVDELADMHLRMVEWQVLFLCALRRCACAPRES
jgi:hypothetical protein